MMVLKNSLTSVMVAGWDLPVTSFRAFSTCLALILGAGLTVVDDLAAVGFDSGATAASSSSSAISAALLTTCSCLSFPALSSFSAASKLPISPDLIFALIPSLAYSSFSYSLPLGASRVSEYEKLLYASEGIKAKIRSGEIGSLDAALKLLSAGKDKQEQVVSRAAEIAEEEEEAAVAPESKPTAAKSSTTVKPAPKIKAKHVEKALKEVTGKSHPATITEVSEFFKTIIKPKSGYRMPAVMFASDMVHWCQGAKGADAKVKESFDLLAGRVITAPASRTKAKSTIKKPLPAGRGNSRKAVGRTSNSTKTASAGKGGRGQGRSKSRRKNK